jgi:hypothetical protein
MALTTSKVKTPLGMQTLDFWPIKEEPDGKHPTYDAVVNLGAAVKGYLSVTTATASISGDDITQVEDEVFTGGQLDTETTMNDLQVNAILFGHTFSEEIGEESKGSDRAKPGGVSFIEPILLKDKTTIYRATCLRKCSAMPSSEKQEADTKKAGELNPKMNVVSFKVMEDNLQSWRVRNDFKTRADAEAFIKTTFGAAAGG